ncbi:hypothetical protein ACFQAT_23415 [Undibacterium arcticum]|uniref:hypothetical protein n=1 Tax=Undibacterium arcticum TaxID=1762892 RepID=UPI0036209427
MLTATYALVAIAVEHKKTWATSSTLQQYLQSSSKARQAIDPLGLESVVNQLVQIDDSCHQRKVEVYVIPAIRKATREADSLLAELESLSTLGASILRSVVAQSRQVCVQGMVQIRELYCSMELYCQSLLQRLAKEEEELFLIARRVIPNEEWFAICAQFLSLDAEMMRANDPRMQCGIQWGPFQ